MHRGIIHHLTTEKSPIYNAHVLTPENKTNIRVIRLLHDYKAGPSPPIYCELKVVSLDDAPTYKALSYVWGDEAVTKFILLDGILFSVRQNLFDFLAQCRSKRYMGYLWIDALCIDQSNIQERNHQVALMGRVYSEAEMVIAWLGSSLQLAQAVEELCDCETLSDVQLTQALYIVSQNHYWNRLWIVQEFVLCRKLEVWSEYAQIDGELFCELFSLRLNDGKSKATNPEVHRKLDLCYWSNVRTVASYRAQNKRMDSFMDDFLSCQCSDRRDRIYGLLGVLNAKQNADFPIQPDYSKPVSRLFLETWIMWLTSIPNEPITEHESTWWLGVHRYAKRLDKRLQLTRIDDGEISEMVLGDIVERRKKDGHGDSSPWSEQIRADHVQALLASAKGRFGTLEDLDEFKKFE
jgi:hypothetical protein